MMFTFTAVQLQGVLWLLHRRHARDVLRRLRRYCERWAISTALHHIGHGASSSPGLEKPFVCGVSLASCAKGPHRGGANLGLRPSVKGGGQDGRPNAALADGVHRCTKVAHDTISRPPDCADYCTDAWTSREFWRLSWRKSLAYIASCWIRIPPCRMSGMGIVQAMGCASVLGMHAPSAAAVCPICSQPSWLGPCPSPTSGIAVSESDN